MGDVIFNFQFEITAYMSAQNVIAIEYFYILNTASKEPECSNQEKPPATTAKPTTKPTTPPAAAPSQAWWWIILAIVLSLLLLIIILGGIYCIIVATRSQSHDCGNK